MKIRDPHFPLVVQLNDVLVDHTVKHEDNIHESGLFRLV